MMLFELTSGCALGRFVGLVDDGLDALGERRGVRSVEYLLVDLDSLGYLVS